MESQSIQIYLNWFFSKWRRSFIEIIDDSLKCDTKKEILFIIGSKGGEGKTALALWLLNRGFVDKGKSAQFLNNRKEEMMIKDCDPSKRIIIFDIEKGREISLPFIKSIENISQEMSKSVIVIFTSQYPSSRILKYMMNKLCCFEITNGELYKLKTT